MLLDAPVVSQDKQFNSAWKYKPSRTASRLKMAVQSNNSENVSAFIINHDDGGHSHMTDCPRRHLHSVAVEASKLTRLQITQMSVISVEISHNKKQHSSG